jgi:hypothetical protein
VIEAIVGADPIISWSRCVPVRDGFVLGWLLGRVITSAEPFTSEFIVRREMLGLLPYD